VSISPELKEKIDGIIASDDVVLFMKGNRNFPQCGFSATVVQILNGIIDNYTTVNVLADPDVRQGIKVYSSWPTIPQLYIRGEFVGGCDIVKELNQSGELYTKLDATPGEVEPPAVEITDSAAAVLRNALAEGDDADFVHLSVSPAFQHGLELAPKGFADVEVVANGITVLVDSSSAKRANGIKIDFVQKAAGAGFHIENPNAPASHKEIGPAGLKAMLDAGEVKELFDVRTQQERDTANIGGVLFDDAAVAHIEGLSKDTPLAFYCRSGQRSRSVAEHFVKQGFKQVYNLAGGILAWSDAVDPSIPKY